MTAEEYLAQTKYRYITGSMPVLSMGEVHPFIKDDKIYCTGTIIINNTEYEFIKIDLDEQIILGLPKRSIYQLKYPKIIFNTWKRLNKFFHDTVISAEFPNQDRELVQLRINVNLIYQSPLPREDKLQWADWIKELYWNRKAILNEWYIKYVLPF